MRAIHDSESCDQDGETIQAGWAAQDGPQAAILGGRNTIFQLAANTYDI